MITTARVLFIGAWTGAIAGYFVTILMSVAAEADERDEIEARASQGARASLGDWAASSGPFSFNTWREE
jgi:hypothetical protein